MTRVNVALPVFSIAFLVSPLNWPGEILTRTNTVFTWRLTSTHGHGHPPFGTASLTLPPNPLTKTFEVTTSFKFLCIQTYYVGIIFPRDLTESSHPLPGTGLLVSRHR